MANGIRDHVWVIDTAGAALIASEEIRIDHVRWVGATTAGHQAEIANGAGQVMWASVASGANFLEESHGLDLRVRDGFSVPTLGSGKLYIYLDLSPR